MNERVPMAASRRTSPHHATDVPPMARIPRDGPVCGALRVTSIRDTRAGRIGVFVVLPVAERKPTEAMAAASCRRDRAWLRKLRP